MDKKNMVTNSKNVLYAEQKINSNDTQAINDTDYKRHVSKVSIPEEEGVREAKDWVDNGSRL